MPIRGDRVRSGLASRARVGLKLAVAVPVVLGASAVLAGGAGASRPRAGSGGGTVGKVVSVQAGARTFRVRTSSGSAIDVKVTKATVYRDSLVHSPGFADLKVGVSVAVIGTTAHGTETATLVIIGGASSSGSSPASGGPGGFRRPGAFGKVTSVDKKAHTFVVKESSGKKVKVKVGTSTTFRDRQKAHAGFSSVKVGEEVAVSGTTKHGVDEATSVLLGVGRLFPKPAG